MNEQNLINFVIEFADVPKRFVATTFKPIQLKWSGIDPQHSSQSSWSGIDERNDQFYLSGMERCEQYYHDTDTTISNKKMNTTTCFIRQGQASKGGSYEDSYNCDTVYDANNHNDTAWRWKIWPKATNKTAHVTINKSDIIKTYRSKIDYEEKQVLSKYTGLRQIIYFFALHCRVCLPCFQFC